MAGFRRPALVELVGYVDEKDGVGRCHVLAVQRTDTVLRERDDARVRNTNGHVLGIDIIRFGAALMVAIFHLAYWSWAPGESLTKSVSGGVVEFPSLARFTWVGWVGVEIFFVISGFVISYSAAGASSSSFLRGRVLRLYPTAWICATATLGAVVLLGRAGPDTAASYARTMALWIQGPWIDGVYWTLGIEIVFYGLVYAVLCLGRFGSIPGILGAMALVSSAFWGGLAFSRVWPEVLPLGFLHDLRASPASAFLLLRHGCFFALGGMLWLRQTRRLGPWWVFLFGLCLLSGTVEIADTARDIVAPIGDTAAKRMAAGAVWLIAVGCMAAAIHFQQPLRRRLGRSATTVELLGLMTYPLYLLHDTIGAALLKAAFLAGEPPAGALAIAVAIVLTLSWIVTRFLEAPVRVWLRGVLSRVTIIGRPERVGNILNPPPNW